MKKNVVLVVALLALMAVRVFAQTEADFVVAVSKDGKSVAITGYKGSAMAVNIPAKIKNLPVTIIDDEAFMEAKITSVTIPGGVTSIGEAAFMNCNSLTSVTIPNTVTTIGKESFNMCVKLASITIPNSVTSIGNSAFKGCYFTSLNIPNSVKSIGSSAFEMCALLANITIGNGVTSIGTSAFRNCTVLTSVTFAGTIPASGLNANAFNGLGDIRDKFYAKDKDKGTAGTYTRPDANNTTWTLSTSAAAAPAAVKPEIEFKLANNAYTIVGRKGNFQGALVIPGTYNNLPVISIEPNAFELSSLITDLTISPGIKTIDNGAFKFCTSLKSVTIPNTVTTINKWAFQNCTSLTSVTFQGTVNFIDGLDSFPGDLRAKFYATDKTKGTPGTYTSADGGKTWTKK